MSNTGDNRNFRKVDVDKYDENAFEEDAATETVAFNESEVSSLINGYARFLKVATTQAQSRRLVPAGWSLRTMLKIRWEVLWQTSLVDSFLRLNQNIKANNIPELVNGLSEDEKNSLMKVIYMTFKAKPEADHTLTHAWFDKVGFC